MAVQAVIYLGICLPWNLVYSPYYAVRYRTLSKPELGPDPSVTGIIHGSVGRGFKPRDIFHPHDDDKIPVSIPTTLKELTEEECCAK